MFKTIVVASFTLLVAANSFAENTENNNSKPQQPDTSQVAESAENQSATSIPWSTIETVLKADVDANFYVQAVVKSIDPPDEGTLQPWKLYIEDKTGLILMVVFQEIWDAYQKDVQSQNVILAESGQPQIPDLIPGMVIQVYGQTQKYKDNQQFVALGHNWFRIAPGVEQNPSAFVTQAPAEENQFIPLSQVDIGKIGTNLMVHGSVEKFSAFDPEKSRTPAQIYLNDGTGSIRIVYWGEIDEGLKEKGLDIQEGSVLKVMGEVSEYRGELQIKLKSPSHIAADT